MNYKSTLLPSIITATILLLTGCGNSSDPTNNIAKAKAYVKSEQRSSAEIEIRNALAKEPRNIEALTILGDIYYDQGRIRDAFKAYSSIKQIGEADSKCLARIASIQAAAGMPKEAAENARAALELDPNTPDAAMVLTETVQDLQTNEKVLFELESFPESAANFAAIGALKLKSGKIKEAQSRFEEALSIDNQLAAAHSGLFLINQSQGLTEQAANHLKQAARLSPNRSAFKIIYANYLNQTRGEEAAINYLDGVIEKAADYLPALSLQAEFKVKTGKIKEAKELVQRALKLDRTDIRAMRLEGMISFNQGEVDESIKQLELMLQVYPKDLQANYQLALAYLSQSNKTAAKKHLNPVVQGMPNHMEANALLSNILVDENDFTGAIITLERFLTTTPNSLEGKLLLANVHNQKGDSKAALKIYGELEKTAPKDSTINYLSGVSHMKEQDQQKARTSFESALENNPTHLKSLQYLTAIDLNEKNNSNAIQRIEQAIAAAPENSALHTIRGQILQSMHQLDEAVAAFEQAIELSPQNSPARMLLARLLQFQGNKDQALKQLESVISIAPDHLDALSAIASIQEEEKNYSDAIESYELILKKDSKNLFALNNLSYLYSNHNGDNEKALELIKRARDVAPNDPFIADTLGWIAYKLGDYEWALSLLQESYRKLSKIQEVAYHLGSAHYMLGNQPEALEFLSLATKQVESYIGFETAKQKIKVLSNAPDNTAKAAPQIYKEVLNSNPDDTFALTFLAETQRMSGETTMSLSNFKRVLEISPSHLAARIGLAHALFDADEKQQAIDYANQAAKKAPKNKTVLRIQGQYASENGDHSWAINRFSQLLELTPEDISVHKSLVQSYFGIGDLDSTTRQIEKIYSFSEIEYFKDWEKAISYIQDRSDPSVTDVEVTEEMGQLYSGYKALEKREYPSAEATFNQIIQSYPKQAQAKLGLAEILVLDPENAEIVAKLASEVRERFPSNIHAAALEAISLYQSGKTEQALRILVNIDQGSRRKLGQSIHSLLNAVDQDQNEN